MINSKEFEVGFSIRDFHGHLGQYSVFHSANALGNDAVKVLDLCGFECTCIAPYIALLEDCTYGNELSATVAKNHPGRIFGLGCVNPYNEKETQDQLRFCFEKNKFAALKIHPFMNNASDNHPGYNIALEYADKNSLAILWHYGGGVSMLQQLSKKYPNANFVAAHYGGAWNGFSHDEILDVVKVCPNVYTDTASSISCYGALEKLVALIGSEKIVFGSDFSFLDPAYQAGRVLRARITDIEKENILHGNFDRLVAL